MSLADHTPSPARRWSGQAGRWSVLARRAATQFRAVGSWPSVTAGLGCVAAFVVIYALAVRTGPGQVLENAMRTVASNTSHPFPTLDPGNSWIAAFILMPPAIVAVYWMLRPRRYLAGMVAAGTVLAANVTTQLVKAGLARPELADNHGGWLANSLPSGHTTMAASAAGAVFLMCEPRKKPLVGAIAAGWAAAWGGLIYVEAWHRPADMITAYLVVGAWVVLGGWLIRFLSYPADAAEENPQSTVDPAHTSTIVSICWLVGGAGTAVGLFCALRAGVILHADGTSADPWLWVAASCLSAAPAFLLAALGIEHFAKASYRVPTNAVEAGTAERRTGPERSS